MLLAMGVSTFFINGIPTNIKGSRKLRNPPSSLVFFLVVYFKKTPLFPKGVIIFIIYFIWLFISINPEPVSFEIPYLVFLPTSLTPVSKRVLLVTFYELKSGLWFAFLILL